MKPIYISHQFWRNLIFGLLLVPLVLIAETTKSTQKMMDDIWLPVHQGALKGVVDLNVRDAVLEEVLGGLTYPWAFEFINDDEILITQLSGQLFRYQLSSKKLIEVSGLPEIAGGFPQVGLLDVEIHPEFAKNQRIYFSYVQLDPVTQQFFRTAVATAVLRDKQLLNVRNILESEHFSWSPSNFGGALEFDDKGYLYISIGNRSEDWNAAIKGRLEGKILRLHDDGSVPKDNPFIGVEGVDDRIYALGVRNPQGLHFDKVSGRMFESEHGPMGGDEVNIIEAGKNYGWPEITYGRDYTMDPIGSGTHKKGLQQPIFYYLPSQAISPITIYRGDMFKEWEGDLLVGALKGKLISKLDLDGDRIRSEHDILKQLEARIRDIKVASDGSIYILTQAGSLYRLSRKVNKDTPEPPANTALIYELICSGCHDSGAYEAPRLSVFSDWKKTLEQPLEKTYQNTIKGYGGMPERGLCGMCTDEFLKLLVDEMLDKVQQLDKSSE